MTRQVVLDTETTGLDPSQGHRIIEIGCVELIDRRVTGNNYHQYIQPDREIDSGAVEVHGITSEFLADKPRFYDVVDDFLDYVGESELIIHNAPFDIGFIRYELTLINKSWEDYEQLWPVVDTLALARKLNPGQKNSLDALCKRYEIDNSQRNLHGALLDAEILADVYLAMTGGQESLFLGGESFHATKNNPVKKIDSKRPPIKVIHANDAELAQHERLMMIVEKESGKSGLWKNH